MEEGRKKLENRKQFLQLRQKFEDIYKEIESAILKAEKSLQDKSLNRDIATRNLQDLKSLEVKIELADSLLREAQQLGDDEFEEMEQRWMGLKKQRITALEALLQYLRKLDEFEQKLAKVEADLETLAGRLVKIQSEPGKRRSRKLLHWLQGSLY